MSNIWVTSDLHLNHNKDFVWGARGFNSVQEMNEAIINNWNNVVANNDVVYLLGDVWLGELGEGYSLFNQLNGNIYVALGNHDTTAREEAMLHATNVCDVQIGYRLKYHKYSLILTHYPTIVTNGMDKSKIVCLCGHTHTKDPFVHWEYGCYHVEVDAHNCTPILLDDIMKEIEEH